MVNEGLALRADGAATGTEHGSAAAGGLVATGTTSDARVVDATVSAASRRMAGMSHLSDRMKRDTGVTVVVCVVDRPAQRGNRNGFVIDPRSFAMTN